jgi:hypothetical protein
VLAATGARVVEGEAVVGRAMDRFDGAGRLNDESVEEQLREVTDVLLLEAQPRDSGKLAA